MIAVTFSIKLSSIQLSRCCIWALVWPYPIAFPGMGASDSHNKFNFFCRQSQTLVGTFEHMNSL